MSASCRARTMALNSWTWPPGVGAGTVLGVRGEEADGVVAPVVGQALVDQGRVVGEVMDRHQLDRRDAKALEVLDDRGMGDRGVGAAAALRDVGMRLGEALDVGLVDDRVGVFVLRRAVGAPVEERIDDDRLGHAGRRVLVVAAVFVAEVVAEQRLVPLVKVPSIAFAYGSSSSLFELQRSPLAGS